MGMSNEWQNFHFWVNYPFNKWFTESFIQNADSIKKLSKWLTVRSKRDISPSEGHFGVKTIMATILKGRSKPKCSKLATSNGTDGYFGPHDPLRWFFPWWRRHCVGTGWWRRRALKETVVWSPTPFNPSKLSLRRVNPLKELRHRDEPFRMERRVSLCQKVMGVTRSVGEAKRERHFQSLPDWLTS